MKKPDVFWFLFWSIITLATIFGCDRGGNPPSPPPDVVREVTQEEMDLVTAHNNYRKQQGLNFLMVEARLNKAAQGHADWMAANNRMSHTGAGGSTLGTRLKAAGYRYSYAGENIAAGYSTVETVMNGWKGSTGHRNNILNPNFQEIGIAVAKSASGKKYWCVDFGKSIATSGLSPHIPEQNLPGGLEEKE